MILNCLLYNIFQQCNLPSCPNGYLVQWRETIRRAAEKIVWILGVLVFGFGFDLPLFKLKQSVLNFKTTEVGVERKGLFLELNDHYCCLPYFLRAKGMWLREYPQSIKCSNTIELIIWLQNELCTAQDAHSEYSMHANTHINAPHHKKNFASQYFWSHLQFKDHCLSSLLPLHPYYPLKTLCVWQTFHTVHWMKKSKTLINPI